MYTQDTQSNQEPSEKILERLKYFKQSTQQTIKQMGLQNYIDPEDIHQEIAISISNRKSPEPIRNLDAYLRTCIKHQLFKCKKKVEKELRSSRPVESIPENIPTPQNSDTYAKLRYLVTQLKELDRKIIEYSFFEGLKATEIANKLNAEEYNITPNNVRQRKKRAIDKLRDFF